MSEERTTQRSSAAERREEILEAAIQEFALNGLAGSSTEAISARVGVSQPYLFKLFGTKKKLFLAAYDRVVDCMDDILREAAEAAPNNPQAAMNAAYASMVDRRTELQMLLQAYAASGDEEVRAHVRARESQTFAEVVAYMGGAEHAARVWYGLGLMATIGALLDLPQFIE